MKKLITFIALFVIIFFNACRGRDEKGNTDANNTSLSKRNTDSTRDKANNNTSVQDTVEKAP